MKRVLLFTCFLLIQLSLIAQCDNTLPVLETFETNVIDVCWDVEDQDGDSYNWIWWEFSSYYGGYKVIASHSQSSTTPDNWIISHAIDLTSFSAGENITLSWKVRGELSYAAHEYYTVYAALGNQTSDFESSAIQRSEYTDEVGGAGVFVTRSIDISDLAGNSVYIAFRHHNTTNQSAINIDELSITTSTLGIDDLNTDTIRHYYNRESDDLILNSPQNPFDTIEIYNILGKKVLFKRSSNNRETINLSTLQNGIYIAHMNIEERMHTIKFIKY
ncbi:T9SS-dependent choice-of-anchor J family protein [Gaetbulibacter saemankumensis]|uniref:T9SS-dependent choice-of-anchor J family protein n=1 Tax=Gaetbulibacter saemankumensis TaxID=311208 RepID=UPI00041409D7|nr:choice-of-anchor J domain-containing protein [Gaetbulibacter saemankumensis]